MRWIQRYGQGLLWNRRTTAKQVGSEGKHEVVESADGIAKQVGSRWKRVANGKEKGQVQRDRDASSGRGSCRKSIEVHDKAYETDQEKRDDEHIDISIHNRDQVGKTSNPRENM